MLVTLSPRPSRPAPLRGLSESMINSPKWIVVRIAAGRQLVGIDPGIAGTHTVRVLEEGWRQGAGGGANRA